MNIWAKLEVELDEPVWYLKDQIRRKLNVPIPKQQLFFKKNKGNRDGIVKKIEDDINLGHYNVETNDEIFLTHRPNDRIYPFPRPVQYLHPPPSSPSGAAVGGPGRISFLPPHLEEYLHPPPSSPSGAALGGPGAAVGIETADAAAIDLDLLDFGPVDRRPNDLGPITLDPDRVVVDLDD